MSIKFTLFIVGIINIIEGVLGLISGEVYVRHWHQVTSIEASMWLLSGLIFIFISKKLKDK